MRGDGTLYLHQGDLTLHDEDSGLLTVGNSLTVETLGVDVLDGGLNATNTALTGVVGSLFSNAAARTAPLLSIYSAMPSNDSYRCIDFKTGYTHEPETRPIYNGNSQFEVFGSGMTKINNGGLRITEGTLSLKNDIATIETAVIISTHNYDFDGTVMSLNFAGNVTDYASLGYDFFRGTTTTNAGVAEIQTITTSVGDTIGGTFTLSFGGSATTDLANDISDADMLTALNLLTGLDSGVAVTRTATATTGCFAWSVTFTGLGNVAALAATSSLLTGTAADATVQTVQDAALTTVKQHTITGFGEMDTTGIITITATTATPPSSSIGITTCHHRHHHNHLAISTHYYRYCLCHHRCPVHYGWNTRRCAWGTGDPSSPSYIIRYK
jgi:hypothetical protein